MRIEPGISASGEVVPPRIHLSFVEGLRAIAALTVYVNHAYAQTWREDMGEHATGLFAPFRFFMLYGHLAVSVFIVLSGFCLCLPVADAGGQIEGGVLHFFRRRARRILPPYYAALGLSLALIASVIGQPTGTLWDVPIEVDFQAVVAHVALVQDFFRTGRINYAFWSIAVEWHLYFLFPLIVAAARRWGIGRAVLAALCIGYAIRFGFAGTRIERASPHYLGLFALGMLAAYVARARAVRHLRTHWGWGALALGLLALTLLLAGTWGVPLAHARLHYLDLLVGLMAMAALVSASVAPERGLTRLLSARPLVFIGTFSYSLYLVHAPMLQLMWQYVLAPMQLTQTEVFFSLMTAGLGAVLAFSYGFFRLCERPFMRAVPRSGKGEERKRPQPSPEQVSHAA